MIISVSSFNILPIDDFNEMILTFDEKDYQPLNQYFEHMGYNSKNILLNIGNLFLVMIGMFGVMLILLLMYFLCLKNKYVFKVYAWLKR